MKENRMDLDYLQDILDAINKINTFISGMTLKRLRMMIKQSLL
jgi:uncharacterized protein with HEPN domain